MELPTPRNDSQEEEEEEEEEVLTLHFLSLFFCSFVDYCPFSLSITTSCCCCCCCCFVAFLSCGFSSLH